MRELERIEQVGKNIRLGLELNDLALDAMDSSKTDKKWKIYFIYFKYFIFIYLYSTQNNFLFHFQNDKKNNPKWKEAYNEIINTEFEMLQIFLQKIEVYYLCISLNIVQSESIKTTGC